jgi:hypothetical protein
MRHPLAVALGVSAAVHLAGLGVLVAARPRGHAPSPMRVHVLGAPGESTASTQPAQRGPDSTEQGRLAARTAAARREVSQATAERAPSAPVQVARQNGEPMHAARRTPVPPAEPADAPLTGAESRDAERPRYQDDIWVLTEEHPGGGAAARTPSEGSGARGDPAGPQGALPSDPLPHTGGSGPPSLLGELSARLARSAARCTPAGVVRSSRGGAPEVPLHFCLDAAGRPSAVGLEGTTGSELLDRAARDCVVPGAAPLPPLPGCYTVAVRFPVRG